MFLKAMMIVYFLFFLPDIRAQDTTTALGFKVSNAFPKKVENCFLQEQTMAPPGLGAKVGCVALCKSKSLCLLACIRGQTCRLYSANVSPQFAGTDDVGPELSDNNCYSMWAEHGDLAPYSSFTSSSVHFQHSSTGANDGFGCRRANAVYMFATNLEPNPWIEADLGSAKWIDRVVVQTRGVAGKDPTGTKNEPNYFENVYARVGTAPGRGNYGAFTLLMHYQGSESLGEIVTFKGKDPLLGRFVSLQVGSSASYLIISEMKIIEA